MAWTSITGVIYNLVQFWPSLYHAILWERGSRDNCLCMPTVNQSHMTLGTKSPDKKSSLLVDFNHLRLFAESCTSIYQKSLVNNEHVQTIVLAPSLS